MLRCWPFCRCLSLFIAQFTFLKDIEWHHNHNGMILDRLDLDLAVFVIRQSIRRDVPLIPYYDIQKDTLR